MEIQLRQDGLLICWAFYSIKFIFFAFQFRILNQPEFGCVYLVLNIQKAARM